MSFILKQSSCCTKHQVIGQQRPNGITVMLMQEEGVLRGQELENAVFDEDYTRAIQIAFELRRPHKLFELFGQLCR